jgi:deferrochelatase/peroxidase EfeB
VRQAMPWGDAVRKNAGLFFIAYTKVRSLSLSQ